MPQRLKVLACGVFERELRAVVERCGNEVEIELLDAGLHARPNELRRRAQEAIENAETEFFDALLLGYGLCGRGVAGLRAKSKPVVIPRVHDCISLFLGSRHEYRRQFATHPGTYYITSGWYEKKSHPRQTRSKGLSECASLRQHPRFPEYAERYGEDNAEYILRFFDSWKKNYTRAAFIDIGLGDSATYARYTEEIARDLGWEFEHIEGSLRLLEQLVSGDWPASDFLVVPPGHRVVETGKNDLFAAVPVGVRAEPVSPGRPGVAAQGTRVLVADVDSRPRGRTPHLGLGIDAGGTYTDSVLYSFDEARVLSKAKALTTPRDYADGIAASVRQLQDSLFASVDVVCLSTTLATNAIVEGRGGRVGLILLPHDPDVADTIGIRPVRVLNGRIDITGREIVPLDEPQARAAIRSLIDKEHVDAIAISGFGGTRNPKHEIRLKQLVSEVARDAGIGPLPVICGHELSSKLDFIKRAHTAALNARLLPVIEALIRSVKSALAELGIQATLMAVKGDGTLVSEDVARQRPVETVLSGPAASATGAVFLTGEANAVAIDVGGTTTDTALIADGRVAVSPEGAQVGKWRTSVDAVDMLTTGLGGDSVIGLDRDMSLTLGPQRAVPLAYLAYQDPGVGAELKALVEQSAHTHHTPESLDFFALVQADGRSRLSDREREILDALADGPKSRTRLTRQLGYMAPSLLRTARLEELGYVRRAALTPTDMLHFTGEFVAWDRVAATHALETFACMMQQTPKEAAERIRLEVVRRLALEIIRRYVSISTDPSALDDCPVCRLFMDNLFSGVRRDEFACRFDVLKPIVGIGAPAGAFMPAVGKLLSAKVIIPEHADVANAIGAITSKVIVSENAIIRPSDAGDYIVHTSVEKREFEQISEAQDYAERLIADLLRAKAPLYGTADSEIKLRVNERAGRLSTGEHVFLEMTIEGAIVGQPVLTD